MSARLSLGDLLRSIGNYDAVWSNYIYVPGLGTRQSQELKQNRAI